MGLGVGGCPTNPNRGKRRQGYHGPHGARTNQPKFLGVTHAHRVFQPLSQEKRRQARRKQREPSERCPSLPLTRGVGAFGIVYLAAGEGRIERSDQALPEEFRSAPIGRTQKGKGRQLHATTLMVSAHLHFRRGRA
jgi:hypothetical protein